MGIAAKLANNLMLFVSLVGLAEGSQLAEKLGLDPRRSSRSRRSRRGSRRRCAPGTRCRAWSRRARERDFDATFSTMLAEKDLSFALAASDAPGCPCPRAWPSTQFERLIDEGFGGKDCSLIVKSPRPTAPSSGSILTRGEGPHDRRPRPLTTVVGVSDRSVWSSRGDPGRRVPVWLLFINVRFDDEIPSGPVAAPPRCRHRHPSGSASDEPTTTAPASRTGGPRDRLRSSAVSIETSGKVRVIRASQRLAAARPREPADHQWSRCARLSSVRDLW